MSDPQTVYQPETPPQQPVYTSPQPQVNLQQPNPTYSQGSPTIVVQHVHKEKSLVDYFLDWVKFYAGLALFKLVAVGVTLLFLAILFVIIVSATPGGWAMITA
jgi:hypothetical protein